MRTRSIFRLLVALTLVFVVGHLHETLAQSQILVDIDDLTPQEHRQEGFVLTSQTTVDIEAVGARYRQGRTNWISGDGDQQDLWSANAWILDAQTREIVWNLSMEDTDRIKKGLRQFEGSIVLPEGVYEAHYASFVATSWYNDVGSFLSNIIRSVTSDEKRDRFGGPYVDNGAYREFRLIISGEGWSASTKDIVEAIDAFTETAIVSLRPYPDETETYGFELERPTKVDLYAIGESNESGEYDYGWIVDADTRERVWELDYRNSDHAGGANKNRFVRESLNLPAGRYVAYFVADDSHDPGDWNSVPPFDPEFWGLTILLPGDTGRMYVKTFEYEAVPANGTFVSLTRVDDDELLSEGFTLGREMNVNIYAIGEGTRNDMVDYAWIVDASTRRRVWTMRYRDTEHAGGATKNRLYDGQISLDAGSYIVYFRSDGSHSYYDWNSSPPVEAKYWGVSLFADEKDLDAIGPLERKPGGNVLAELIRIRDDEYARQSFSLDERTTVRIYALGEGDSGDMYDYAWIEDRDSGRTVWEMKYRRTEHAGGARKNRLFDSTIELRAGDYRLYYESDGSHSYEDWNADLPDDPESWGVTITRVDDR